MTDYLLLLAGVALAGLGGEAFVRGVVALARWGRVSAGIVGATLAAFATSSPELAVAISSAASGRPQISLGDALGSNVVNIGLILGLALGIRGLTASRDALRRDFPVALLVPIVIGVCSLDNRLSRLDGALMAGAFAVWITITVRRARQQRRAADPAASVEPLAPGLAYSAAGLVLLFAAGRLIVEGARGIALAHGIGEFVIGATLVAVGTSVPELATTLVARLRGHDEVGLGTVLGSNIFNGFFVVPTAALITPIAIEWREVGVALLAGLATVAFTLPGRDGLLTRRRGALLLAVYAVYVAAVFWR